MTYSKTRATKDHPAEYSPTVNPAAIGGPSVPPESMAILDRTPHQPPLVPSTANVRDRFAAPEYVNPHARLPRIQALRGENGASECGYFITETEMAKAGWGQIDESQTIVYEYNSGGKERGLLIQSPRM